MAKTPRAAIATIISEEIRSDGFSMVSSERPTFTYTAVPGKIPKNVVIIKIRVLMLNNAGTILTKKKGNIGTRRKKNKYDTALSFISPSILEYNLPARLRRLSPKLLFAIQKIIVAPIVAAITTAIVPVIKPNRKPPVRVNSDAKGSESATVKA